MKAADHEAPSTAVEARHTRRRRRRRTVLVAAVALALAVWMAGDVLLARALTFSARRAAGWKVTADHVRARLFPARVRIENLAVANPAGFPEGAAIVMREVYVEHGGRAEKPGESVWRELRLDVARLSIIRRADGEMNIERLIAELPESPGPPPRARRQASVPPPSQRPPTTSALERPLPPSSTGAPDHPTTPAAPSRPRPAETPPARSVPPSSPPRTWRIERLIVKIGEMEWKDESRGGIPSARIPLNLALTFTNVTDFVEVGDRLATMLAVAMAPKLLEEALGPLLE